AHFSSFSSPSTMDLYTLSLHDALPISSRAACMVPHRSFSTQILAWRMAFLMALALDEPWALMTGCRAPRKGAPPYSSLSICFFRSEEHTSELQSRFDLVCRLLLEKKKS